MTTVLWVRSLGIRKTVRPLLSSGIGGSGRGSSQGGHPDTILSRSGSISAQRTSPTTPMIRLSRQSTREWASDKAS